MMELNRDTGNHVTATQEWAVKAVCGKEVTLKMAGTRSNGEGNTFALKHLLAPTKDTSINDDIKLKRRVWNRVDKNGDNKLNVGGHRKAQGASAGLSRKDKYGGALKYDSDHSKVKNTVICLGLLSLDLVLTEIATALVGKTVTEIEVTFSKPCVKTVDLNGLITGPVDKIKMSVDSRGSDVFEIYHLKS